MGRGAGASLSSRTELSSWTKHGPSVRTSNRDEVHGSTHCRLVPMPPKRYRKFCRIGFPVERRTYMREYSQETWQNLKVYFGLGTSSFGPSSPKHRLDDGDALTRWATRKLVVSRCSCLWRTLATLAAMFALPTLQVTAFPIHSEL